MPQTELDNDMNEAIEQITVVTITLTVQKFATTQNGAF